MKKISYRRFCNSDPIECLTDLLHAAYREVASRTGIHYWASYQDSETTVKRIAKGECFLAMEATAMVGTLTLYRSEESLGSPWFELPDVTSFGQFAVRPGYQGLGIGSQLIAIAEQRALEMGMRELALDTAEAIPESVAMYHKMGYRFIETVTWPQDVFRSVVLSKTLENRLPG